ncbi:carboxylesterase/lipase family protein [Kribbella deserti]|uniref:Carboxylic ester hydrolase n=1 Tax=Kribbella deserti TaxID=1926257 RepID=A0ABV6QEM5_9ACTN
MRVLGIALALVLGFAPVGSTATTATSAEVSGGPRVKVDGGEVEGVRTGRVERYNGIPFAAPPLGPRRWRAPQPAPAWSGVRSGRDARPNCLQDPHDGVPGPQSEDCLYLNVTTPARKSREPLPVMVWLYGGGFFQGAGNDYDPARLVADGNVIVVTPNYRLGTFGFLAMPDLPDAGSFGLLDQRAALRWVQRNAKSFGGDPGKVTLFGESAGGMSTCALLTSPQTKGLFHRAIMQSGTCDTEWPAYLPKGLGPFQRVDELRRQGLAFAKELGCTTIACLRAKPADLLQTGMKTFGPAYGTSLLPLEPSEALRRGTFHRVPTLVGTTRDESRLSIAFAVPRPLTPQGYRDLLAEDYGPDAARVVKRYPPVQGDNGMNYADLSTDRTWAFTTRRTQDALAGRTPLYAYEFADRNAPAFKGMPNPGYPYGAFHGSELNYLFEILGEKPAFTPAQRDLAAAMVQVWTTFAATGRPGWPAYGATGRVQSFAPGNIGPTNYVRNHQLDFWSDLHGR